MKLQSVTVVASNENRALATTIAGVVISNSKIKKNSTVQCSVA